MGRSVKKGPFVQEALVKKVDALNSKNEKRVVKTWSRASTVLPEFVGHTFAVHNGNKFIPVYVTEFMPIGARVTLRGEKMYEFLDRLVSASLPRVRDFRGVNDKSFDGRGNYTMGVTEQIIFPEIDIDKVNKITGMDITFVTTAKTNEEAYELLKELGMPFRNAKKEGTN